MGMTKGSNITKKQHYIPQVYLRGFSPEYERNKIDLPVPKYTIYCYDLSVQNQISKAIPIKSVCYEDDLYEVTNINEERILTNYLERLFSALEKRFSTYRHELEKKVFIRDNYKTKCFLSKEEKVFWVTYIVVQILRMPQILEIAENVSQETLEINAEQAKNIAIFLCLPFFRKMEEDNKEVVIFNALINSMKDMSIGVGVDRQKKMITSDKPVFIYHTGDFWGEEYESVIFPITSEICLFFLGKEEKKRCPKNFLFEIDDAQREVVFKAMVDSSFGKIYSNHLLDTKEQRFVEEVLMEKEV